MRIPDEKIEEVRAASDIVDIIAASVPLKKRGKNYVGRCPFHQEKTPSFTVSSEKQMYHCFGCGAGGNVFTFVMELEKVSFVEAVRTLAERAGVRLPEPGREDRTEATEHEALYAATRAAALFFHENLVNSVEGKLGLEYFRHRGLAEDTIRRFGLGYSMNGWDSLVRHAESAHFDLRLIERAGLIIQRDDGTGFYDRFRGRAMFPILLATGRPIAFGARKLREDDPLGKYINSPETPIYSKSRVLYGLSHAREAIREQQQAVIVEGYLDLISVFQAGIHNIVASSGTALTDEQLELLGRYARTVVLVYDADSAGSRATIRGVDLALEHGLDVQVAELPAGDDPDTFVRKNGEAGFRDLLKSSVSFLDFKAGVFAREGLLQTPEGKTRAVRSIVESISRMKDELKRNFYIKSVAEKYDIYESVLFRELESLLSRERGRRSTEEGTPSSQPQVAPVSSPRPAPVAAEGPVPAPERELLRVMLDYGQEIADLVFSHMEPAMFTHARARLVAEHIRSLAAGEKEWDATALLDRLPDDETRRFVADLVFAKYELSKNWEDYGVEAEPGDPRAVARDAIATMRVRDIDEQLREAFRHLKLAESKGEPVRSYQEQIMRLQADRKNLLAWRTERGTRPS